jgi:hypothetical protein
MPPQRQQMLVLRRTIVRSAGRRRIALLVPLVGRARAGRRHACPGSGRSPLAVETVVVIRRRASENPLWGPNRSVANA